MQFRLTYEGPILAETKKGEKVAGRAKQKHEIRKVFHAQLKRLWQLHPTLSGNLGPIQDGCIVLDPDSELADHTVDGLKNRFYRIGYSFVPLVTHTLGVHCGLDILFLRHDPPGAVVHFGDLDNRVKTIVDALKMPGDVLQLGGYTIPVADEEPFFCLLEDDSLITRFTVEADTLLEPLRANSSVSDARVVITVTLKPYVTTVFNQGFG